MDLEAAVNISGLEAVEVAVNIPALEAMEVALHIPGLNEVAVNIPGLDVVEDEVAVNILSSGFEFELLEYSTLQML